MWLRGGTTLNQLRLLGLAEASVLVGLGIVWWLDIIDHFAFIVLMAVVGVAFLVPSLLAIRSERQANERLR